MQQNDDDKKDYSDIVDTPDEKKTEDKEDWLNEHGNPSNTFLQSLAEDGGPEAMEKLRSIATDLDVDFGPGDSAEELIGKIRSATQDDPNTTT
jgi:hypothetical protein